MTATSSGSASTSADVVSTDDDGGGVDVTGVLSPSPDMRRNDAPGDLGSEDDTAVGGPRTVEIAPSREPRPGRRLEPEEDTRRRPGHRTVRIVRRVQLWSVFKVALLGSIVLYAICLIAVALLWSLAMSAGQVHHIEKFMRDIGFRNWTFDGAVLFQAVAFLGAVGMVVTSVMLTLWAAVVNVVSELTGGIRFTIIETDELDDDDEDRDDPVRAPRRRFRRRVE